LKLADLAPNPRNPRKISDKKLEMLKAALAEFGDLSGIVYNVRTQRLAGGHQRVKVLPPDAEITIERTHETPTQSGTVAEGFAMIEGERFVYRQVDWDETKEKAANIAANKHGGEFDLPGLSEWLLELDAENFNLDLTGFTPEELENLMAPVHVLDPQCDEDEVPEVKDEPKTKRGDIYQLGRHRLMCGDSTSIDDYNRLMLGEKPVLMVTDPPYGVKLDQSWRDEALGDKALGKGNSNLVSNDDRADWYDVWAICNADVAYVWHASSFSDVVMDSLRRAAFQVRQQIIWNKSVMIMGRGAYHWKHEPCWYAVRNGCDANWVGDRKQVTVWDAAPPTHIMGGSTEDKTAHPTQKPILVYEIPIQNHTRRGDLLYEPFSGSGSAFIACEKHDRRVFGMELDPRYVDLIVARWEKFTGKTAELIPNG
jgi:DNA modification methylase